MTNAEERRRPHRKDAAPENKNRSIRVAQSPDTDGVIRCGVCRRPLSAPDSIERGVGLACLAKIVHVQLGLVGGGRRG